MVDGIEVDRCGERDAEEETPVSSEVPDDEQVFRLPKGIVLADAAKNSPEEIAKLRVFWRRTLKKQNITKIVAPMVDQSELAFRMMLRENGAHLTYTPMIHAHLFVNDHTYRRNSLAFCKKDRPLIVQFCANKPETFLAACRLVEGYCDGVDLNLGCPQMVAKRGRYGAYLQEQVDLVCEMVNAVRDYCKLPISCKIRIRDCPEETRNYAKRLVEAGATMLTVHGRTREMKGAETGIADWERIKQIVDCVDVPVIANGNIQMPGDVERCIAATGAVAVMSAEGILYNPLLFAEEHKESWQVAAQYLDYARRFQAGTSAVRAHVFRIMHHSLLEFADLRLRVSTEHRLEDFESVVEEVRRRVRELADSFLGQTATEAALALFGQIREGAALDTVKIALSPHWLCKPYFRLPENVKESMLAEGEKSYKQQRKEELQKKADELGISIKQAKKRNKRKIQHEKVLICKRTKFPPCERCNQPAGQGCRQKMCKRCCKYISKQKRLDCGAHKARWSHLPPIEAPAEVDPVA